MGYTSAQAFSMASSKSLMNQAGLHCVRCYLSTAYWTIWRTVLYCAIVFLVKSAYTRGTASPSSSPMFLCRHPSIVETWVKSEGDVLNVPSMNHVPLVHNNSIFCRVEKTNTQSRSSASSTFSYSSSLSLSLELYMRNLSFKNICWNLSGRSLSSLNKWGLGSKCFRLSRRISFARASRFGIWMRTARLTGCSSVRSICDGGCPGLSAAFRLSDFVKRTAVVSSQLGECRCCDSAFPLYITTTLPGCG